MEDIQPSKNPSNQTEKENLKGINNINSSAVNGDESSHSNVLFDDAEAHIRYKDFKIKQVSISFETKKFHSG